MKKIALTILALLLINASLAAPLIQISASQTNMLPGETGYLKVTLTNQGSSTSYQTRITLSSLDNPLTSEKLCTSVCNIYSTAQNTCLDYGDCYINLGDIGVNSAKTYTIPLHIPSNITTGYYSANLQVKYQNDTLSGPAYMDDTELININNLNANPYLSIESVKMPLDEIVPGETFNLTLNVVNSGVSDADNVKITLSSDVFNTVGTSNTLSLSDITQGKSSNVTFALVSDPSTSVGVYTVSVIINYTKNSQAFSTGEKFGVQLGGPNTDFEVYVQSATQTSTGVTVSVKIANVGLLGASAVSVALKGDESGAKYIGDLASGSYAQSSLTIASNNMTGFNRTRMNNGNVPNGTIPNGVMPNGSVPNANMTNSQFSNGMPIVFVISYTNLLGQRVTENVTKSVSFSSVSNGFTATAIVNQTASSGINVLSIVSWSFVAGMLVLVVYFFVKSRRKGK